MENNITLELYKEAGYKIRIFSENILILVNRQNEFLEYVNINLLENNLEALFKYIWPKCIKRYPDLNYSLMYNNEEKLFSSTITIKNFIDDTDYLISNVSYISMYNSFCFCILRLLKL